MEKIAIQDLPILAPKAQLLNLRLIHFNSFIAFICWISIAKNHPVKIFKSKKKSISNKNKLKLK